ncbi:MAG: sugar phosphate isomerase/epimerase family protein [Kiritimatiellia bacterium]|jgi:sugar phosphate isomerase/epimerase
MKRNLACNTDFAESTGDPELALRPLAEAGFTHLHWCHHWNDDFLYTKPEIDHIRGLLKKYGLKLLDVHGSQGWEKCWNSTVEHQRKAGVEIVANRIDMLRELGGSGAVMMHVPFYSVRPDQQDEEARARVKAGFDALCRSLDELMPLLDREDAIIAVENMWDDDWSTIEALLDRYPENRLGLCYDSGHANASTNKRMDSLERNKSRLQALHLHDNDGSGDQHQPPFFGTIDWARLAKIIATSSYTREISFEIAMHSTPFFVPDLPRGRPQPYETRLAFARDAHERCSRFVQMVETSGQGCLKGCFVVN